jgi:hypothetical protein
MRRVISVLVVVGLALAVVLLWANRGGDPTPGTEAQATTTTRPPPTSTLPADTTTLAETTTTSPTEIEVVETVEQAEAILRELWFGWFEGIYNEDEDRIREVVVLEETVDTAQEAFGDEFSANPRSEDISFAGTEVLRSDEECLAVLTEMKLTNFREGSSQSVHVLRSTTDGWKRLSLWQFEEDMWEQDCDSQLPSPSQ